MYLASITHLPEKGIFSQKCSYSFRFIGPFQRIRNWNFPNGYPCRCIKRPCFTYNHFFFVLSCLNSFCFMVVFCACYSLFLHSVTVMILSQSYKVRRKHLLNEAVVHKHRCMEFDTIGTFGWCFQVFISPIQCRARIILPIFPIIPLNSITSSRSIEEFVSQIFLFCHFLDLKVVQAWIFRRK